MLLELLHMPEQIETGSCGYVEQQKKKKKRGWRVCVRVLYLSEQRVSDTVQVDGALVSQVVKDVEGAHRLWASLLVAENKVNPLMKLT